MGEQGRTFERDDDNLFTTFPAPLFDVVQCMDEDACIDDDEICILVRRTVARLAWFLLFPVPVFWLVSLSVGVVFLGLFLGGWGARPCSVGEGCAAVIRGVRLWLTSISPVPRGRAASDGLFELFDLMAEECGTESAGHGELVGRGCCGRSLGRDEVRGEAEKERKHTLVSAMMSRLRARGRVIYHHCLWCNLCQHTLS